jgi:hypothetical protein
MKKYNEQEMLDEFSEFAQVEPVAPSKDIDDTVTRMVARDLLPPSLKVYSKFALIEVFSGLLTLTLCPQFGLGFGSHLEVLHRLHAATSSAVFYLMCGALFVTFGAALGGLILTRFEIRAVSPARNRYFAFFSLLAYVVLVTLGPEVFVASSLTWVVGAMLGNVLGYGAVIRLRQAWLWQ